MNRHNLVRMANQIGAFFESFPDREQAREEIANHLLRFWEPRMRAQLLAQMDSEPDDGLSTIVRETLATHRPRLL